MSTYILIHNPNVPNVPGIQENPIQEIADSMREEKSATRKLVTTKFGGWSIGTNELNIKPGERLLFYRSAVEPTGFFAVGRVLPAEDSDCRNLREKALRCWYRGRPDADYELDDAITLGFAAYKGPNWQRGKGNKTIHINAEWNVVADPEKHPTILVRCNTSALGVARASGFCIPDDKATIADDICAKCMNAPNALKLG